MRYPSDKEIEEAKDYIRKRLEAERSMERNLRSAMLRAAEKIISISRKYGIPPRMFRFSQDKNLKREVEAVIADLRATIEDYTYTLAVATHNDKEDEILAYITRDSYGKTFSERNAIYANRYKYELESAIAASMLVGTSQSDTLQFISQNLEHPYDNPDFTEAVKAGDMNATRIQTDGISYGVGRTNSSFTALRNLTVYAVAEGWMRYQYLLGTEQGAKGFITFRSSSFPCQTCDEYAMRPHPMSAPYPPLHNHCVCGMAFVY